METALLPGITIRQATPDDAATFVEIHEEAARWVLSRGIQQWTPGTFRIEWILAPIARGEVYVAIEAGAVIATAVIESADPETWGEASAADTASYIHGLRVRRSAAGRGIGLALLRWAEREIAARGNHLARLDCFAANETLCTYYERAGYRRVGTHVFHDEEEPYTVALFEKAVGARSGQRGGEVNTRLQRFDGIEAFAARAEPYLLAHEATHCLMLGLLSTLPRGRVPSDKMPYMALVEQDGAIVLVAMRTPPFNLILSLVAPEFATDMDEALALVARDVRTCYGDEMPGVIGPVPMSLRFAEQWREQTGREPRLAISERIYALETVIPVAHVPGTYRHVTEADRDVMVRWLAAFAAEALSPMEHLDAAEWVNSFFATPSRDGYLWEDDGAPVSLVAYGNPTKHGIRIGPVYTPPESRGRGYASACVAVTSQHLLDSGRTFCFLFTDLANPTSNHIYQMVGYNPVSDVDVYHFMTEK